MVSRSARAPVCRARARHVPSARGARRSRSRCQSGRKQRRDRPRPSRPRRRRPRLRGRLSARRCSRQCDRSQRRLPLPVDPRHAGRSRRPWGSSSRPTLRPLQRPSPADATCRALSCAPRLTKPRCIVVCSASGLPDGTSRQSTDPSGPWHTGLDLARSSLRAPDFYQHCIFVSLRADPTTMRVEPGPEGRSSQHDASHLGQPRGCPNQDASRLCQFWHRPWTT
jgi:hypothetical protein